MRIRPAEPPDSAAIRRVSAGSCRAAYEGFLDDETLIETMEDPAMTGRIREKLAEVQNDDRVVYLVATRDGDVRGFIQLLTGDRAPDRTDPDEAYLQSLYVHPTCWGEGIGSNLLAAGIERLPESKRRLSLGVLVDNEVGRGFYETHGFEQVDTGGYEVDGVSYETAIYEKVLDE